MLKINPVIALPIDSYLDEIVDSFKTHNNLILTAPPGSGKTTRVAVALLNNIRSKAAENKPVIPKKIIVLVPKRIAALSAASRIAEENNWTIGKEVGYQVRFENKTDNNTALIFMTEGVFVKKLQDQKMWSDLELVIFDEFHERSSLLDLALGICFEKQILEQNLKMLIMSATLDTLSLQNYLGESKLIVVNTKPYLLEIIKSKKSQRLNIDFQFAELLIESIYSALNKSKGKSEKDILVFLPGLSEIRFVERLLRERFKGFEIHILHGSIKLEEQKRILQSAAHRRLILATNIAESSLTLPSVDCVIDSGLVKKSVTEVKIGFKKLELVRISLFSAKQRAGRAARTGPGTCYQLWHELDERSMPETIQPEILSSDLLEESLTLLSLGVNNPEQFSWLDRPKKKFSEALEQLQKWELINTDKGQLVQATPLDIERSLLFVELSLRGQQKQAAALLAFLETENFDKQTESVELEQIKLNDLGLKIEAQLNRLSIRPTALSAKSFKENLICIFFKYFPNKVAKKKEKNFSVSSLGRGVELSSYLVTSTAEYFLLLSGREHSSALSKCDFAIAFTAKEFEKHSPENTRKVVEISFDSEKNRLFKIVKKMAGGFVISESVKAYIDEKQYPQLFGDYFKNHFSVFLEKHEHYKNYVTKTNFLKKKTAHNFAYLTKLESDIFDSIAGSIRTVDEFFSLNLYDIILYSTPLEIKKDLAQLPTHFTLPGGKVIPIDYESEQAPKISARIQELFGQTTNPTLLRGRLRMTVELLAPNYRPTQVTSQLENFWKTSYFEIKKELKARYPKHAWPDDPSNYQGPAYCKPLPKKK